MTVEDNPDTRTRLLNAAADLIAADPGEDFSLRAVCDAAGVKMPTLYHFFGSKQGLIEAVIERGFDMYLEQKASTESSGDPLRDIRAGWDAHVAFGIANPGFYTLMYGKVRPGHSPAAQARPTEILRSLTRQAEEQGRLVVDADQAANHILVTNIGVTLRQIVLAAEDRPLSIAVREAALAAITGTSAHPLHSTGLGHDVIEYAAARPERLGVAETHLLIEWIQRLSDRT